MSNSIPVILIFDVGKTNKKMLLFNEEYRIVWEQSGVLEETADEDGFPCEDIHRLTEWLRESIEQVMSDTRFEIRAINFSAYGASFVYLDEQGQVAAPLYNYLKPYSDTLLSRFYRSNGGESLLAKQTASPVLGSLNSGMQLYRLKYEKPELFGKISCALHLPQYLSYVACGVRSADITSIGCHTNLWHFQERKYHAWVKREGMDMKLPELQPCTEPVGQLNHHIPVGGGLHDSSAALIPYLASFSEPFVLLSTGTWCISLNPFNHSLLTDFELQQDCLCYLSYKGNPVKASRLFAGYEHEEQVKRLASHFQKDPGFYKSVKADPGLIIQMKPEPGKMQAIGSGAMTGRSAFGQRDLGGFDSYEKAYHQLIADIMEQQVRSTNIILKGTAVKRIFVDGGFGQNEIYMQLLASCFPGISVFAATVPQASALGAALAIHPHWNQHPFPTGIVELKPYSNQF